MEMEGTLQLKVLKAELLIDTDWFGKMDPFVVLKLNDQSYQTTVKKNNGKNPSWFETFAFRAKEGESIRFDVFDKDFIKSDDLIGQGVFEIKDILCTNKDLVVKLYRKGTSYVGELFLETRFFPDPNEYVKMISSLQKQINFELKEMEKLQKDLRNTNKLLDFEEQQKNRKNVITEACLVGNRKDHLEEEFRKLEHSYELQIREINLSIESHEKTITLLHENIKKGQEYIVLMNNETNIYKYPPPQGKLHITCKNGNFSRSTTSFGTMDPCALFSLGNCFFKTKKIKNGGKTPVWEEEFDLIRYKGENMLKCEAYHDNDLIGYGFLNINWIVIRGAEYNTQIKLFFLKDALKEAGYINLVMKFDRE